jgi:hypothetical protein
MDYKLPLVILAVVAILLFGKGITGFMVVSQSCCVAGSMDCSSDNACTIDQQNAKTDNLSLIVFGSLIMVATMLVYRVYHKHEVF